MTGSIDVASELGELLLGSLGRPTRPSSLLAEDLTAAPDALAEVALEPLAGELVRRALREQQFQELGPDARSAFEALCARTLAELAGKELDGAALDEVARRHRAEVERLLGPRRAISRQYTPSLQLDVLGLGLDAIRDPVLDVGCGARAALVRFLRAEAHDAHGIDRDAPRDVAVVADWLEFDYGSERWGTVLSHLGFSLHFLHQHLGGSDKAEAYAKVYLAILRSLRAGGTFAYVPSLPFIEAHLPAERFEVKKSVLGGALGAALAPARGETGLDLGSATRVRRVG